MACSVFHSLYKLPIVFGNQLYASKSLQLRMSKTSFIISSIPLHCISQLNDKMPSLALKTCKNCKTQYDPVLNHPHACRFHTAHFGGETKRKFESVYSGGTMNSPNSGQVFQYWHCCGSEDPCDPGCTASPHVSYDD